MSDRNRALVALNKSIGPKYNAAAEHTRWRNERVFFEAQVRRTKGLAAAVAAETPATMESLVLAVRECASMGLTMSPNAALVYFIPRRLRKIRQGESKQEYERTVPIVVTATPSYRGLAYQASHYAGAADVAAEVVYSADKFRYFGPLRELEHEPTIDNNERVEAKAIGAYAMIRMRNGSVRCEYVDAPTIIKIRQLSDFPNSLMWTKLWTEGWKKVPVRRICKLAMTSSPEIQASIGAMNRAEGIAFPGDDGGPAPDEQTPPGGRIYEGEVVPAQERPRGMDGLGAALNRDVEEPEDYDPQPDPGPPPSRFSVPSKHPVGSIEYWYQQIDGAQTREHLDDIRVAALEDHVDASDDADLFKARYKKRSEEIRAGQQR